MAVTGQNRDFGYDAPGRLLSATGPWGTGSFVYDALGNIREKTLGTRQVEMHYNGSNQLSGVRITDNGVAGAWQTYAYADGRGNVTHNGRLGFTYDRAEQPVTMTGQASGAFVYDGNLKRVKQTVNGRTVYSIYGLGGRLLYRDDITGSETTDYIAAGGIPVGRWVNGVPQYVHHEYLGSPVAATDSAGTVLWREEYLPFGAKRQNPPGNADDVGYTGHVQDAATGLTYMQARYYDPVIGRFLSPDPVGFSVARPAMFNRYAYVDNDPINATDPDGRLSREFNWVNRQLGIEPPPRSPDDWLGPAIGIALGGMLTLAVPDPTDIALGAAVTRFAWALNAGRGFSQARRYIKSVADNMRSTGGRSARRTTEFDGRGGQEGAEKMFDGLTGGKSVERDGGRLGTLGDGSRVQMSTRTMKDGTQVTSIRIGRERVGSRIRDHIKVRFKEDELN